MSRQDRNASGNDKRAGKRSHWKLILAAELLIVVILAGVIVFLHGSITDTDRREQSASGAEGNEATEDIVDTAGDVADIVQNEIPSAGKKGRNGSSGHGKNGGYIVFIETGHGTDTEGEWDTGCTWSDGTNTYEEAEVMIPVARAMVKYLRQSGIEVITDADGGNKSNLFAALDYMDIHQMDAFVNLHCDSDGAPSGVMPLYRTDEQKELGLTLAKAVHEYIDIADRGPQYREDLNTLNSEKPNCPACLFECGCISTDNHILTGQHDEYGKALAKGLCDYLGVEFAGDEDSGDSKEDRGE